MKFSIYVEKQLLYEISYLLKKYGRKIQNGRQKHVFHGGGGVTGCKILYLRYSSLIMIFTALFSTFEFSLSLVKIIQNGRQNTFFTQN